MGEDDKIHRFVDMRIGLTALLRTSPLLKARILGGGGLPLRCADDFLRYLRIPMKEVEIIKVPVADHVSRS